MISELFGTMDQVSCDSIHDLDLRERDKNECKGNRCGIAFLRASSGSTCVWEASN
jgi:hypothetical protein